MSDSFGYTSSASKEAPESYNMKAESMDESSDYSQNQSASQRAEPNAERKIIRNADFRMQVDNVEKSTAQIENMIKLKGGYTSSVNLSTNGSYVNNNITIRIPNEKLDSLLDDITKEATHVDHKRITSTDVTEEFVDLKIRLETKKQVRDRYIDILQNKAKTVEEILSSEERIRVIQEEIESKEGRLRYLSNQVSLSTIHLEIYQYDGTGIVRATYLNKVGRAFANGWDNMKGFLLVLVNLWPFWIMLGIIIYFVRKWRTRSK